MNFNITKIAIAIRKGFQSVSDEVDEKKVNLVFECVLEYICNNYGNRKTIKVEEIQDIIEKVLTQYNFNDVQRSFSEYRMKRKLSREMFNEKELHKFSSIIDAFDFTKLCETGASGLNELVIREYIKSFLIDNKTSKNIDEGLIYLNNFNYISTPKIETLNLDLKDQISSYPLEKAVMIIYNLLISNKEDIIDSQNICFFDYDLSYSLLNTYKNCLCDYIVFLFNYECFDKFFNLDKITDKIKKLNTIDASILEEYMINSKFKNILNACHERTLKTINHVAYSSIKVLLQNINATDNLKVSINIGTNTTLEGKIITGQLLELSKEIKSDNYHIIFKIKKDINYLENTSNHDLYIKSLDLNDIYYSLLDSSINKKNLINNNHKTEIAYDYMGQRVQTNYINNDSLVSAKRGVLFNITFNICRCALSSDKDLTKFYELLDESLDAIKSALLQRYDLISSNTPKNYKSIFDNNLWVKSENLEDNDKIKKAIKYGLINIRLSGIYECMYYLCDGKIDNTFVIKTLKYINDYLLKVSLDNNVNICLSSVSDEKINKRFCSIDASIYGIIKSVTDEYCLQYSQKFKTTNDKIVELEGALQEYFTGGHMLDIKVKSKNNKKRIIDKMLKSNVSFTRIRGE